MPGAACPAPDDLERVILGGLSESDALILEQHLQGCGSCVARLDQLFRAKDILAGLLRRGDGADPFAASPVVVNLANSIKTRCAAGANPLQGNPMLTITCSTCQKMLAVKEEFAGKKVKCPGCGQVMVVPAQAAAAVGVADRGTQPPKAEPQRSSAEASALASAPSGDAKQGTHPPLSNPDPTQGLEPAAKHDSSLTDFLAAPQADDELGRLGAFRILKILGHGGMGVVFLGEDATLRRKVAIKAMLPHLAQSKSSHERFLREARAAAALEHDHIVAIHHVGEDRGAPYIVMPFLKGRPLDACLEASGGPMPLGEVLRIGREVARALDAAHKAGLIHRDIKPANVWLEAPEDRVKILDFGLARAASQEPGLTQQGAIIGTPAYMAPEQGRGDTVDARCDLFSLGVVLYRMSTGQVPFHGKDTVSTLMAVALHEPPAPAQLNPAVPRELSDLVMRLLEKDVDRRLASAADVVATLRAIEKKLPQVKTEDDRTEALGAPSHGGSVPSRASIPLAAPVRRRSPVGMAIAAALVLLAVGVATAGIFYWQTNNGVVRIEINDPEIKVAFDKDGPIVTGVDKKDITLRAGDHGFHVKRGDLEFDTDTFILRRGDTITLKIEWLKDARLVATLDGTVIKEKSLPPPVAPVVAAAATKFALAFDGKQSRVVLPTLKYAGDTPLTVEAWAALDRPVNEQRVEIVLGNPEQAGFGIASGSRGPGKFGFGFFVQPQTGPGATAEQKQPLSRHQFIHLAGVYDGKTEVRFYVNGVLQNRAPAAGKYKVSPVPITLGANPDANNRFVEFYLGRMSTVRFSKSARYDADFTPAKRFEPDADTLALYQFDEGSGDVLKDSSGNGHDGKIVGATWVKQDATRVPEAKSATSPRLALRFTGKSPATVISSLPVCDDEPFTIEMLISTDEKKLCSVMCVNEGPQRTRMGYFINQGGLNFQVRGVRGAPLDLAPGVHHVAGVFDGKAFCLYLDGKQKARNWPPGPRGKCDRPWELGTNFTGMLGELRISKVARYAKDFTPAHRFEPDKDTIALYHMDEGSGDVLTDSSGNGHHGKIIGATWVKVDEVPRKAPGADGQFALKFTGGGKGVELPNLRQPLASPLTVEMHVADLLARRNTFPYKAGDLISLADDWHVGLGGSWGALWYCVGPHRAALPHNAASNIQDGVVSGKNHIASVWTDNQLRLFVNGKCVSRVPCTPNVKFDTKAPYLGGLGLTGTVWEVRISKSARYDADFKPAQRFEPDADTLALYHMDEGSGDKLIDSSGNGRHGKIVGAQWVKADGSLVTAPPEVGWVQLFNGKDLQGWKVFPEGTGAWKVVDGAIVSSGGPSHLFSERGDYENFHFRVEAAINATGDSGQYFRTQFGPGLPRGYEAQISGNRFGGKAMTGSLHGILPIKVIGEPLHQPDEWFTQEVIAIGDHIGVKVNGKVVVDVHDKALSRGHLALQHRGAGTVVKFRRVEIKELKADGTPIAPKNAEDPVYVPATLTEKEAKKLQADWAAKLKVPVETTSKTGVALILIPPGGAALPKPYWLGKYEVTQDEWEAVMGYNPSYCKKGRKDVEGLDTSRFPVERVSWYDCVEFCNKLSAREGLTPYYELKVLKRNSDQHIAAAEVTIVGGTGYHLPTEAEWEHAYRAGSKTKYHFGDNDKGLLEYAWTHVNSGNRPHQVGELKANAFGLYDMYGNVAEWTGELRMDAKGNPDGMLRGGSYAQDHRENGFRQSSWPASITHFSGLRVARVGLALDKGKAE